MGDLLGCCTNLFYVHQKTIEKNYNKIETKISNKTTRLCPVNILIIVLLWLKLKAFVVLH